MGLSGCGKFLKFSMFLFNAVILLAGCGLLGFGVYVRTLSDGKIKQISQILGPEMHSVVTWSLIISGGVVIILAFFGCCGAIKEVKCMLGTFFLMLFAMLTGLLVVGVLTYLYQADIASYIKDKMQTSLNQLYGTPDNDDLTKAWDFLHQTFHCCGVSGGVNSTDSWYYYRNSVWFQQNEQKTYEDGEYLKYIPNSCCVDKKNQLNLTKCHGGYGTDLYKTIIPVVDINSTIFTAAMENDQLFTDGCYNSVIELLSTNIIILAGCIAGVGVLMIMGMVFSICLCRRIEDEFYLE